MTTVALVLAGWFVSAVVAALIVGPLLRRNAKRYPLPPLPDPWKEIAMPMTEEQERQLYVAYRRTAAMQPGGLIVSRRA